MATSVALPADLALIIATAALIGFAGYRVGQPPIVAYLLTGLLLGPAGFAVVEPSEITFAMAELGLAFLLFLLGIKMRIEDFEHILRPIAKISVPQLILVCVTGVSTALLLGFPPRVALLIGLVAMYSSTAVVVKGLTDKDEVTSPPGKIDVGVLLVQDIVVVLLLTVLATGHHERATDVGLALLVSLGMIASIGVVTAAASRYLLPRLFRQIADNKHVFFLVAIGWAFLFVLVSETLGLSIEMGAFLAGVAVAQVPYSTELRDRVAPLADLFVLTFFVSIGLQLDATALFTYWREAVVAAAVLMPAKFLIFFGLIRWQGFSLETAFLGSANMIQISEFALVAGSVALAGGFVDEPVLGFLSLVAVITMGVSVYVIEYNHELFDRTGPLLDRWETDDERVGRREGYRNHAVVVGYDEVARTVLPILEEWYEDVVVIDRTVSHVEALEATETDVIYGDCRYAEVRNAAGLKHADFVLSSAAELDVNTGLLGEVGERTTVFAEAEWVEDARELYDHGAHFVVLSSHLAAERLAEYVVAYFRDRTAFADAIGSDIATLRRSGPSRRPDAPLEGDLDE